MPKTCPGCNAALSGKTKFCPECGLPQPPAQKSGGRLKIVAIVVCAFVALVIGGVISVTVNHGTSTTGNTTVDNGAAPSLADLREARPVAEPPLVTGPPLVTLTLKASRDSNSVHLSGTTNLPDGAVITYEVQEVNGAWITDDEYAKVKHGRYAAIVKNVPSDKLEAWAAFIIMKEIHQPQKLIEMYGRNGKKIPNGVTQYGGSRRVETTTIVR